MLLFSPLALSANRNNPQSHQLPTQIISQLSQQITILPPPTRHTIIFFLPPRQLSPRQLLPQPTITYLPLPQHTAPVATTNKYIFNAATTTTDYNPAAATANTTNKYIFNAAMATADYNPAATTANITIYNPPPPRRFTTLPSMP